MDYLALPFVLRNGYLDRSDVNESLRFSIGLILCTRHGSMPFEPEFGCGIWEKEFSDILSANKADIRSNLRNAIDKYERRLFNVSVSLINITDERQQAIGMAVKVTGNYTEDNQEQRFEASYTLG
ncbi:MAG: GPW/gp25 family protein [candidate division Zixibacteria bacterium]|nr:GPW/gp25 family protein [candidate division Zixibacteria bacterium]